LRASRCRQDAFVLVVVLVVALECLGSNRLRSEDENEDDDEDDTDA